MSFRHVNLHNCIPFFWNLQFSSMAIRSYSSWLQVRQVPKFLFHFISAHLWRHDFNWMSEYQNVIKIYALSKIRTGSVSSKADSFITPRRVWMHFTRDKPPYGFFRIKNWVLQGIFISKWPVLEARGLFWPPGRVYPIDRVRFR